MRNRAEWLPTTTQSNSPRLRRRTRANVPRFYSGFGFTLFMADTRLSSENIFWVVYWVEKICIIFRSATYLQARQMASEVNIWGPTTNVISSPEVIIVILVQFACIFPFGFKQINQSETWHWQLQTCCPFSFYFHEEKSLLRWIWIPKKNKIAQ